MTIEEQLDAASRRGERVELTFKDDYGYNTNTGNVRQVRCYVVPHPGLAHTWLMAKRRDSAGSERIRSVELESVRALGIFRAVIDW